MAPPAVVSNGAAGITTVKSAPVTGRISTVYSEVQITRSLFLLLIALLLAIQMKLPSCSHACLDSLPGDGKGLGSGQNLKIGVVLSGGQAPGGHNVISGIYDYLQDRFKGSTLYGFKGGPAGIMKCKYVTLTSEYIYPYRNQGGFDMICSGRDKIETPEQFKQAQETALRLDLDGLVVIGGDDSNTNACLLAENFRVKI